MVERNVAAAAAALRPHLPWRRLHSRHLFSHRLLVAILLAGGAALGALAAQARTCDRSGCGYLSCATPATPVPSGFWGEIQPAEASFTQCGGSGPAFCRDSTSFIDSSNAYSSFPWFMSVATENGFVMTALAYGLQVWDARTTPANPTPLGQVALSDFPVSASNPEIKLPMQHVATAAGIDTVAAVAGQSGLGIGIVNLANKTLPKVAYQSYLKEGQQVYAATLSGRQYGFLAASSGSPSGGLYIYDMTKALTYDHCAEAVPATGATVQCPGVYLGRLGTRTGVSYVGGVGNYLVLSSGAGSGFEIWDVTQPTSAVLRLSAQPAASTYGVAMWQQGSTYYLALRTDTDALFFDVSCIVGGCGSGLGSALASRALDTGTPSFFVTFSRSGATPFLYFGSDDTCQGGSQREWLFDVTNPASPRDVSPPNYWGWYYRGNPTGFNYIMPRSGKFVGTYFYRAAQSILDIHKWNQGANPTPSIFVNGPTTGSPGQSLTFTASAAICTPNPSGWSWATSGGTISGSATGNSVQVSWPAPGEQDITAMNSACGTATGLAYVDVAGSGGPGLTASFTFSPASPSPGQAVAFDASASAGNPTQYSWTFGDGTGGSGRTVSHTYPAGGNYGVTLIITAPGTDPSCPGGTCTARTTRVVAVGEPPNPDATFTTSASCVNMFGFDECQAQVGQPVSFAATATGPFTYTWDFGDGTHATGPTATHAWTQPTPLLTMQLAVSNGQQTAFQTKLFQINAASTNLLLVGGRFQVDVTWTTSDGKSGSGQAVPLTTDTGYFWFFDAGNIEMVIKVLDACSVNDRYWVFAGGLTNVKVAITVTDTKTNTVNHYANAQGVQFKPVQDANAFATCP